MIGLPKVTHTTPADPVPAAAPDPRERSQQDLADDDISLPPYPPPPDADGPDPEDPPVWWTDDDQDDRDEDAPA